MEIELTRIWRAVRRFWWVVASCAVAFALIGALISSVLPQSYIAHSTVVVLPSTVSGTTLSESGTPVQTYMELIKSDDVLTPVAHAFDLDLSLEEFRSNIAVSNIPGTSLIRVSVTDDDPERAAELANAVTENFSVSSEALVIGVLQDKRDNLAFERDQINSQLAATNSRIEQLTSEDGDTSALEQQRSEKLRLEQRRADLNGDIRELDNTILNTQAPIAVSEVAVPPEKSDGLSPVLLIAVLGVLGAMVGAAIMLWMELREPYVRDEEHLRELLGTEAVTRISAKAGEYETNPSVKLAASRIAGIARKMDSRTVVLASPREGEAMRNVVDAVQKSGPLADLTVHTSHGLLDTGDAADMVVSGSPALLIVETGKTRSDDVKHLAEVLVDMGASSLGAIVLEK